MTLVADLPSTLAQAAAEVDLFSRIADAVRALEGEGVSHVIVSEPRGEIVVIGDDYGYVALRTVTA